MSSFRGTNNVASDGGWAGGLFGGLFLIVYYAIGLAMFWWSCRMVWWFFTGGDFPLPWQPF